MIKTPLSHPSVYWRYRPVGVNQNYLRLSKAVTLEREGVIIDVGANIGDGAALLRGNGVTREILAVEGSGSFAPLLRENAGRLENVNVLEKFLNDGTKESAVRIDVKRGTGRLINDGCGFISFSSLDLICDGLRTSKVCLLKTDTDGFDCKILRGSFNILKTLGPVVFCEVDDTLMRANGDSARKLFDFLASCEYKYAIIWDHNGKFLGEGELSVEPERWLATHPGGDGRPYIDVAVFKAQDAQIFEKVVGQEQSLS